MPHRGSRFTTSPASSGRAAASTACTWPSTRGPTPHACATSTSAGATAAVLRRCEADRRILARHTLDPDVPWEPACKGCGTYGDMELSTTDNVNECPELLDLAHAHGITDEILAGLDQPQPPEPTPAQKRRLRERARLVVPITTSDVPEALRGTRWKP